MAGNELAITVLGGRENPVLELAADELGRYMGRMTGRPGVKAAEGGSRIGLASAFPRLDVPYAADPVVDDGIHIDVGEDGGVIAGVNPRSVLLGVYRYLTELGCRWVRPGPSGEYIPRRTSLRPVKIVEAPSYRHRGICIEGAVSYEHVRDIIDWAPKVGFNAYFIQFREGHTFFARWYAHKGNPHLEGRPLSVEEARRYTAQAVQEIKKRGLLFHAVGHGWTCEPFGISGLGWDRVEEPTEEVRKYLAEVNGERKLWGGVPLNTNLCYGNPKVRRLVANEIAKYAEKHPEIDILHFWLADGSNNNCECALCRDTRPSDFFVQMLNLVDERLTKKGLSTRVVFLAYVDLLWPPEKERIANPDRFILMFAPITRTYSRSFQVGGQLPELPPFVRNKLKFPKSVEENVAFLSAWQEQFGGDSFDFDYHLMWDHYKDPGYSEISKILSEDIKGLKEIGLNGFMSCQTQRAFFPTGLPMTVMGRTLWNSGLSFDDIAADYFDAAFGPDGGLVREYLERLSRLFDPVYLRGEKEKVSPEAAGRFQEAIAHIGDFGVVIQRNVGLGNDCWAKSWEYLRHHAEVCRMFAQALEARARDDKEAAIDEWQGVKEYVTENEMILHPVLDVYLFQSTLGGLFR